MKPQCPSCGQFLPGDDPMCECGHKTSSHSNPGDPPKGCGGSVVTPAGLRPCPCKRHQKEVTGDKPK